MTVKVQSHPALVQSRVDARRTSRQPEIAGVFIHKQRIVRNAGWGMCRQVLKSDGFRFAFLCSFFSYPILFNDPFEVSRHPDSDRG